MTEGDLVWGREASRGNSPMCINTWTEAVKKASPSSGQVASRTKDNEYILKHRRLQLNVTERFFTLRVTDQ